MIGTSGSPHEKLARRLANILRRLNEGQLLVPADLARHFGVSVRTIQRDIARFSGLGLVRSDDGYALEPSRLGRLSIGDLEVFARMAGVDGLFPSVRDSLAWALNQRASEGVRVQGHHYEDLRPRRAEFASLQRAVLEHRRVSFCFEDTVPRKVYDGVEPYALLNLKGIWYLAGQHDGRTKTFSFSKIASLLVADDRFSPDAEVARQVAAEDGVWFQQDSRRVLIEIDASAAPFFRRRRLIAHQEIVQNRSDGSLLLATRVGHDNQVLPIVRYWIPHARIVEPADMQVRLEQQLRAYTASDPVPDGSLRS